MTGELSPVGLPPDDVWSLLSNVRRRRTLVIVEETAGPLDVTELAKRVAAYELEIAVDDVGRQQWRRVYSALVTCHLLPLSQADAVNYDVDEKTIGAAPSTSTLAAWVDAMQSACDATDDFPPARCDVRDDGPVVLE